MAASSSSGPHLTATADIKYANQLFYGLNSGKGSFAEITLDEYNNAIQDEFMNTLNSKYNAKNNYSTISTYYIVYSVLSNRLNNLRLDETAKLKILSIMAGAIAGMLTEITNPSSQGGRSKKQRGGTLEQVYNAQGLITDLASYNDKIVGNTNAPAPFSAGPSTSSITFEMLPTNMVNGLTPSLSSGGAPSRKKKK